MIETALVYIFSLTPSRRFKGCGTLIEGDWVATCRHVLSAIVEIDKSIPALEQIEIEFPHALDEKGARLRSRAAFIDECIKRGGKPPDLTLIAPLAIPNTVTRLRLATHERFETGKGYARAGILGRDKGKPEDIIDRRVPGLIQEETDADGLRQFTGEKSLTYWVDRGSSGSPVFKEGGEQLAGILSKSEIGVNEGKSKLREAAIVPATVIRLHLAWANINRTAFRLQATSENAQLVAARLTAMEVPLADMSSFFERASQEARSRALRPVSPRNLDADIDETIRAARTKMLELDVIGATGLLDTKLAEEETNTQRIVPLLSEKAHLAWIVYDYETAKSILTNVLDIDPGHVETWIDLGDLEMRIGPVNTAIESYEKGLDAVKTLPYPVRLKYQFELCERIANALGAAGDDVGRRRWLREGAAYGEALSRAGLPYRRSPGDSLRAAFSFRRATPGRLAS
jgi:hypothetical protein